MTKTLNNQAQLMPGSRSVSSKLELKPTLLGLVSKEVDLLESLVFEMPEAVALVPALREHVDGNLAANGERQALRTLLVDATPPF